ncbi:MAG: AmmeMemoRadiSam system protein A [Candidatus Paceibacterota bacterium]|jgi:AmmeMemoRadiSam system protein A
MHPLVELARSAVENYAANGTEIAVPFYFPKDLLDKKAGVFVTIEKDKGLRGCIGTYLSCHKNIAEETIHNAILAAAEDYRFGPIEKDELPRLSFTVYILGEPELVRGQKELDHKKYGVIVKSLDKKRVGLLLPDLKGVNTVSDQISIACAKAEIDLSEQIIIYKFTVEKYQ